MPGMEVKILQWNCWHKEQPANILRVLQEIDADFVCRQEICEVNSHFPGLNMPHLISQETYYDVKFFKAQAKKKDGEITRVQGNAILSKFGFASERAFYI